MSARRGSASAVSRTEAVTFARGLLRGKIRARVQIARFGPPVRQILRDGHVIAQGGTWWECYANLRANVQGVES